MLDVHSMSLHSLALKMHYYFSCKPTPVITVEQILIVGVCLFVCKWQQFYMNRKALINRFIWPCRLIILRKSKQQTLSRP